MRASVLAWSLANKGDSMLVCVLLELGPGGSIAAVAYVGAPRGAQEFLVDKTPEYGYRLQQWQGGTLLAEEDV